MTLTSGSMNSESSCSSASERPASSRSLRSPLLIARGREGGEGGGRGRGGGGRGREGEEAGMKGRNEGRGGGKKEEGGKEV